MKLGQLLKTSILCYVLVATIITVIHLEQKNTFRESVSCDTTSSSYQHGDLPNNTNVLPMDTGSKTMEMRDNVIDGKNYIKNAETYVFKYVDAENAFTTYPTVYEAALLCVYTRLIYDYNMDDHSDVFYTEINELSKKAVYQLMSELKIPASSNTRENFLNSPISREQAVYIIDQTLLADTDTDILSTPRDPNYTLNKLYSDTDQISTANIEQAYTRLIINNYLVGCEVENGTERPMLYPQKDMTKGELLRVVAKFNPCDYANRSKSIKLSYDKLYNIITPIFGIPPCLLLIYAVNALYKLKHRAPKVRSHVGVRKERTYK